MKIILNSWYRGAFRGNTNSIVILKPDLPQPTDYLTEDTYIPLLTLGKCYEATFTPLL